MVLKIKTQACLRFTISRKRNALLDEAANQRKNGEGVHISVDGRWSSRRQAMEGTVTCFDNKTKEIIDVQHVGKFA